MDYRDRKTENGHPRPRWPRLLGCQESGLCQAAAAPVSKEEGYTLHKGVTGFLERSHVGTIIATNQKTLSGMTITGVYLDENVL